MSSRSSTSRALVFAALLVGTRRPAGPGGVYLPALVVFVIASAIAERAEAVVDGEELELQLG